MEKYIITTGFSNSTYELNAFDCALLTSGIADYNLVKLSSILPAGCSRVNSIDLAKGSVLHTAYSQYTDNRPGIIISAAISIAIPYDRLLPGVIMEASGLFDEDIASITVSEMACISMKSRGITEYEILKGSVSMTTKEGYNCVVAAVSIW